MSKIIGRGNIMRNYLKFLATAMVAALLICAISVTSFAASTKFSDVDDHDETLSEAVALLSHLEITKGTSETTFGTMESVTREQMAAFVYRLMKPGKSIEGGSNTTPFTDLTDSTYFGYVSWANGMGIIKGTSATTFNPKGGIVLQDAYTMLIRALGHEDDTYAYPFTYIDKAEELGLADGLDAKVGYTTQLRRGDVAILLYNTFFAETGHEETKQVERPIANGAKWVLETKTYYPTIAERIYDVEVGDFEVRATTRYAFNENSGSGEFKPLIDEFDNEMLHLVAVEEDEPLDQFYCEFDGTGLTGNADDYIMRGVKVYYTYEVKNGVKKLDEVYFVSSEHKTIETNSVSWKEVDGKKPADYYNNDENAYEKVENYLTVNNENIYLFDAPYTYLKPNYNAIKVDESLSADDKKTAIEDAKILLRNEKNLKLIDIRCLDLEKGTYEYYIDESKPIGSPEEALETLIRVYSNGVYKMKFFDVDGDGIYEYAHYMPATYGFMDRDDGKYFSTVMEGNKYYKKESNGSSIDLSYVPTIYYNDAVINGVKFEDGDFVTAYLNPDANMIEVMSVIQPYNGYVNNVKPEHGQAKIDSTLFSCAYAYRAVEEFDDESLYNEYHGDSRLYKRHYFGSGSTFPKLISNESVGEVFNFYAMKMPTGLNTIFYYDHLDDATIGFEMDELAIPVSDEDDIYSTYTKSEFDVKFGDSVQYAKVYYNGKVSYLPINEDEMCPALDAGLEGSVYNLSAVESRFGGMAYVDKICKVKLEKDGRYTLIPLLHAEEVVGSNVNYIGVNRDSTTLAEEGNIELYGNDLGEVTGYIKKVAGSRYELVGEDTKTILGDYTGDGVALNYFNITDTTRIVIKNKTDDEDDSIEYLEFDATTFTGSVASALTNIQYILKGDAKSSSRADLVLLYAEAENFEFETKSIKNGMRIVAGSAVSADEDGAFRNFYTLLNPFTGAVEENVPGKTSKKMAADVPEAIESGELIEIKSGMVDESGESLGTIDTSLSEGLVYITEYNADESFISFIPAEVIDGEFDAENICCREDLEELVEDYTYLGNELNFDGEEFKTTVGSNDEPIYNTGLYYEITEDTVISVLTNDKAGTRAVERGEFKLADISAIANSSKEYKCYNNKVLDKKGNFGVGYADYVKAYVYADDAENEDQLPVAEYIIIVVNGGEDMIFTDYDDNFTPKTCEAHE